MSDDLSIRITPAGGSKANAVRVAGWTETAVTRGVEICPVSFDIQATEHYPDSSPDLVVNPGDIAEVYLGADLVITGYVDQYVTTTGPKTHTVRLAGRGKCEDLVDCSAEWPAPGGQITGANALEVAAKLAAPYGISVACLGPLGSSIPQFNLTLTETAWQIIEEVCRYSQLLAYEGTDGNLILNQVGQTRAASGFVEGVNVQAATVTRSADQLFSEYDAFLQAMDVIADTGHGGNLIGRAPDPNVKRHRRHAIIAEAPAGGQNVAEARAIWEAARRAGRARKVNLTTDTWRDSGGTLWTPNTLVSVSLPSHHFERTDLVVSQVTYHRAPGSGTTAELELMPPDAFLPEPILLLPPIAGLT